MFTTAQIDSFLKQHNLHSFTSRLTWNLKTFSHKIVHSTNTPKILKSWLKPVTSTNSSYNLRSNNSTSFKVTYSHSKFGDLNFKNIASKYLNSINFLQFSTSFKAFSKQLTREIPVLLANLSRLLPKLNICTEYYFFLK